MDPLAVRGPNTANHADLVYRHFDELVRQARITRDDDFVIATPGTTSNEQLGLLLGIAAETGVTVSGLVDSGARRKRRAPTPKRALHVDVFLHRAVVTELTRPIRCTRRGSKKIAELGLASLLDAWATSSRIASCATHVSTR